MNTVVIFFVFQSSNYLDMVKVFRLSASAARSCVLSLLLLHMSMSSRCAYVYFNRVSHKLNSARQVL